MTPSWQVMITQGSLKVTCHIHHCVTNIRGNIFPQFATDSKQHNNGKVILRYRFFACILTSDNAYIYHKDLVLVVYTSKCTCLQMLFKYTSAYIISNYIISYIISYSMKTRSIQCQLMARAPFQYPIRCLILRSCEVSKPWDWWFQLLYRFEIWQSHRQQCCRGACQILERSDNLNINLVTSRDLQ